MPKIKMPRSNPSLDMTPMVDLAFLLVTFFMLTASFREAETVTVITPKARSVADKELPKNAIIITIDNTGRVYFDAQLSGGNGPRMEVLDSIVQNYKIAVDDKLRNEWLRCGSFGVEIAKLPEYLSKDDHNRKKMNESGLGIPSDSLHNEIGSLALYGMKIGMRDFIERRQEAERSNAPLDKETQKKIMPRICIKADFDAPYAAVKQVIKALTDKKQYHFTLITTMEQT
jgi:biopolymer transport protein ExbD